MRCGRMGLAVHGFRASVKPFASKVHGLLRAQYLLDKRLFLAAWTEARQVAGAVELNIESSPRALAVMRMAVAGMGLTESRLGSKVENRWANLPQAARDRLIPPAR